MENITWWGIPAVPIILALVEVAKRSGFPAQHAGLLALALGIGGGACVAWFGGQDWPASILSGAAAGLVASGAWSAAKNALEDRSIKPVIYGRSMLDKHLRPRG